MSKLIERDGKYLIEVGPNDSFGSIAYEHTGQSSRWLELLKCNDVDATRPIVSGILLRMPDQWAEERAAGKWAGAPELASDPAPGAEVRYPNAEPATHDGSSSAYLREDLEALLKHLLGQWAEKADETILSLTDKVALLEMKRDQDEKRLAEQGGKIQALEARMAALQTAPPVVEEPNRTGASGGAG